MFPMEELVYGAKSVVNQAGYGGTPQQKSAVAGDPTVMAAPPRTNVPENGGAAYKINYGIDKSYPIENSGTMTNAKPVKPVLSREASFYEGSER